MEIGNLTYKHTAGGCGSHHIQLVQAAFLQYEMHTRSEGGVAAYRPGYNEIISQKVNG